MDLKSLLMKKADIDPNQFAGAVQAANDMNVKRQALKELLMMGGGALGLGAGLRSLSGLLQRTRERSTDPARLHGPATLTFPVPAKEEKKNRLAKAAVNKWGLPWYGPSMALIGVGGIAGGWKAIDNMLKNEKAREREEELDVVRQKFHDALLSQFNKSGSSLEKNLGSLLDEIYDRFEKVGSIKEVFQAIPGMYGTYAVLSGLMSGALVYDQAVKKQRRKVLEKALRTRQQRMYNNVPPELLAVPERVPSSMMSKQEESDLIKRPPASLEGILR